MVVHFRAFEGANWHVQAGRFDAAVAALEPLVSIDPGNSVFRGLLAQAHRGLKNLPRAVRLYREAVAASPADPEARYNLAVTLQEAGRPAEALAAIAEAIRRDPARPEAHNVLGIALLATGKLGEALAEFDRALRLDPRDPSAHNNRGNVLRPLGRLPEAEAAYRRAIALAPTYAEPWNGLGALEVERKRPSTALPFFEKALALAPGYHEARLNRGIALETLGDTRRAVDAYRDFLAAARNDPAFSAQREIARQLIARISRQQPKTRTTEGG
jgi:tetratricopeptide (TPR) repeat protein